MQLDVFIPSRSLAFEYQGKQHYEEVGVFSPLRTYQQRDEEKRSLCAANNIKLIEVPYWWNRTQESLEDIINTSWYCNTNYFTHKQTMMLMLWNKVRVGGTKKEVLIGIESSIHDNESGNIATVVNFLSLFLTVTKIQQSIPKFICALVFIPTPCLPKVCQRKVWWGINNVNSPNRALDDGTLIFTTCYGEFGVQKNIWGWIQKTKTEFRTW